MPDLNAAAARIEHLGRTDFPHSYAGLAVDEARHVVTIYRVPLAGFDAAARAAASPMVVEMRDAPFSATTLGALHDRIVADLDHWRRRGLTIHTVGARHDGTGVEVGASDVAAARSELAERYGAQAPIVVVPQGPVVPLTMPGPATS